MGIENIDAYGSQQIPDSERHDESIAETKVVNDAVQAPPKRRAPFTLQAIVVLSVTAIALSRPIVWLIAIKIPGAEVRTLPPFSEAIAIAAITGLLGVLGGAGYQRGRDQG